MALLDEVGIDVAMHVAQTLAASYSDRMKVPPTLTKMLQGGLLGRKTGRGFYLHRKGKKPQINPQVTEFQSASAERARASADYQARMVLLMINEAARCLEEQVVTEAADVDFAMIMGTGFAPFRGGPLRHADAVGIPALVAEMKRLAESGASHFEPCALLRTMASNEKKFYPKA
jgi:3-hydroxyacyl-CoA dehydrogenase/enoyl-CoA hydratase/3-hydroxybutyryl-CoA epimerase